MKTYVYTVSNFSTERGFNQTVAVYRMKNNEPEWLGSNARINTAASRGERGEAVCLIGEICGHKNNHYKFDSDSIRLFEG